jgi:hypothetical protein
MYLLEEEKVWINLLNQMKIKKVEDFMQIVINPKKVKNTWANFTSGSDGDIAAGAVVNWIENQNEVVGKISRFFSLCEELKNERLIVLADTGRREALYPMLTQYPASVGIPTTLLGVLRNYQKYSIEVIGELSTYIENGYKSRNEIEQEEERSARINSEISTRRIAWASIIISGVLAIGNSVFNYMTYTKERNVNVQNIPTLNIHLSDEQVKQILANSNK